MGAINVQVPGQFTLVWLNCDRQAGDMLVVEGFCPRQGCGIFVYLAKGRAFGK